MHLKSESKSTREVDRFLISKSETPEIHFKEKIIPKTETTTEVRLHLDEETMAALARLREIWSHANPYAGFSDIIKRAAKEAVEKHDPLKKTERSETRLLKKQRSNGKDTRSLETEQGSGHSEGLSVKQKSSGEMSGEISKAESGLGATSAQKWLVMSLRNGRKANEGIHPSEEVRTKEQDQVTMRGTETRDRMTRAQVRSHVWRRDRSQCTYQDPRTGERCTAKHFIEEDHIVPKAMGGEYTIENIRLRCRAHNQRHAIDCYGHGKMRAYLN